MEYVLCDIRSSRKARLQILSESNLSEDLETRKLDRARLTTGY